MSKATSEPRTDLNDRPSHPALAATLLMLGVVVFLVLVAVAEVIT